MQPMDEMVQEYRHYMGPHLAERLLVIAQTTSGIRPALLDILEASHLIQQLVEAAREGDTVKLLDLLHPHVYPVV